MLPRRQERRLSYAISHEVKSKKEKRKNQKGKEKEKEKGKEKEKKGWLPKLLGLREKRTTA